MNNVSFRIGELNIDRSKNRAKPQTDALSVLHRVMPRPAPGSRKDLHSKCTDFPTWLSPTRPPVLHSLSTDLSTGCPRPCDVRAGLNHPRATSRSRESSGF